MSSVKLVVSDLHMSLKPSEIRILVMLRMNHGFMEYMRKTYPNTPLSEFKVTDTYVYLMFTPVSSMLLWTMRKRKKMWRSDDFLVYNDSLCIQFNKIFVDT